MRKTLFIHSARQIWALFAMTLLAVNLVYGAASSGKDDTTYSGGLIYSGTSVVGSYCTGAPTGGKYDSASYSGSSGCTGTVPGTDTDGDTMNDSWETNYSLNKYSASDRYGDPDGDGSSNAREKAQQSKPNGTGTACPGFSTTTITDKDCDGVTDSDDPEPNNASVTILTVNSTYKGGKLQSSDSGH
jgi:hypothetical protein